METLRRFVIAKVLQRPGQVFEVSLHLADIAPGHFDERRVVALVHGLDQAFQFSHIQLYVVQNSLHLQGSVRRLGTNVEINTGKI